MEAIMTNKILDIIRKINGGSVIADQSDEISKVDLFADNVNLYIDEFNSKYYYFADLVVDEEDRKKNNLGQIEKSTVNNLDAYIKVEPPSPNSSYLILFWKVSTIDESIYPQIIQLEENEFFYKKYVFYYTQDELDGFLKWYDEASSNGKGKLSDLLELLSDPSVDVDTPHIRFIIRLLTKMPFIKLVFPRAVLKDFDSIVNAKINSTRGGTREEIKELDSIIAEAINLENSTVDTISNIIYKKLMEE